MKRNRGAAAVWRRPSDWILCATLLGMAGCPGSVVPPDDPPGSTTEEAEPNGSFALANAAVFDEQATARVEGRVSQVGDIDVFSLGSRVRGDRIIVETATPGSPLDVSIAVFDGQGRIVAENDDGGATSDTFLDSFVDFVVRHDGDPYYLVASHSAFAGNSRFVGSYRADVRVMPDSDVPPPVGQVLFLDFDGAFVDSPVLGSFQLDPFDAAEISADYAGDTQLMKDQIRAVFEQNFERFDVVITTSDGPAPAAPFSVIFFGGFNRDAFGLSENVDLYNVDLCDDAIIYTGSFDPSFFDETPTAQQMGIAIGNVGSHEAGHLLGLNHTNDDTDLMDDRSRASAFLFDQEFKEAPMSSDIIAIGTQDGVLLLGETVGLIEGLGVAAKTSEPFRPFDRTAPNSRRSLLESAAERTSTREFLKRLPTGDRRGRPD